MLQRKENSRRDARTATSFNHMNTAHFIKNKSSGTASDNSCNGSVCSVYTPSVLSSLTVLDTIAVEEKKCLFCTPPASPVQSRRRASVGPGQLHNSHIASLGSSGKLFDRAKSTNSLLPAVNGSRSLRPHSPHSVTQAPLSPFLSRPESSSAGLFTPGQTRPLSSSIAYKVTPAVQVRDREIVGTVPTKFPTYACNKVVMAHHRGVFNSMYSSLHEEHSAFKDEQLELQHMVASHGSMAMCAMLDREHKQYYRMKNLGDTAHVNLMPEDGSHRMRSFRAIAKLATVASTVSHAHKEKKAKDKSTDK